MEQDVYCSRIFGGVSRMVWRGFSARGQTELAFLRGKQASKDYIKTIFSIRTPFAEITMKITFISIKKHLKGDVGIFSWVSWNGLRVLRIKILHPTDRYIDICGDSDKIHYNGKQYLTVKKSKGVITLTWILLSWRKLWIHSSGLPLTPILESCSMIPSLQTMSKAFSKSRKTPRVICFLVEDAAISCVSLTMWSTQPRPFLKPAWYWFNMFLLSRNHLSLVAITRSRGLQRVEVREMGR